MAKRYSTELKTKALELYESMCAEDVIKHLQGLKGFKDEAKTLRPSSLCGFKMRMSRNGNSNGNGNGHKAESPARCVHEYMTTFHDNGTVALTLYIPERKLGQVLKQLHLVR